jgi:hypothetical protein
MRRRITLLIVAAIMALTLSLGGATAAFAQPPACEPGAPGCKTGDDPDKNNDKFTVVQRGSTNAKGTEDTRRDCKRFDGSHEGEVRCR